jgi:hypothetical protein
MMQAFNGAGDTTTPKIVYLFGFWLLEIPLAYWLAVPAHLHTNGVYYAIVIAEPAIAAAQRRDVQTREVEASEDLGCPPRAPARSVGCHHLLPLQGRPTSLLGV